ncbi:MAG: phage portal protein [Planctomycetes bacterium]|nr:phage portal protein [Planctomycetota bacterium]
MIDSTHQPDDVGTLNRLQQRLREACDDLWSSFVDPREPFYDDGGEWLALGAAGEAFGVRGAPFTTEVELRQIRLHARRLAVGNEFALNALENRVNYLVGAGHNYRAAPVKGRAPAVEAVAAVQQLLDDFVRDNRWHRRQQELVLRADRDGEAFLRFFFAPDGTTRLRFVEPSQVSTPPDVPASPADSLGIQTETDDVESVVGYWIDGQLIAVDEVQHRKANVDINVKRGLPLLFPVAKNLRRAEKLLRNMTTVAEIQSAIALIRRHRNATRGALQQFVAGQADATQAGPAGRAAYLKRYAPGTILDAHADVDYEFPTAGLDAGSFVTVLQAELRAIAARLVMPEFMLTSDASNANYASTMVAESPAIRMFERLQAQLIEDDLDVLWRVVRHAARVGRLPADVAALVEIQAVPPSLAMRDRLQEAQLYKLQYEAGLLSPQTWSQLSGLDYDQEQANLAQARSKEKKS